MVVAEHGRDCVINRTALMAIVVAHPDGQVIALEYNQPISNRPAIMSGDGVANFNQTFGLRFIELSKSLIAKGEIANEFASAVDGSRNENGFCELDDVHPELGTFPTAESFLTLMKEQKTATDTLRHNLYQSGRN